MFCDSAICALHMRVNTTGSGTWRIFSELNKFVHMATRKCENIVIMGDINIDMDNDKINFETSLT